ncbi:hypothetical protein MHLP_02535 [Candidatus Mycoplasma haematolamae str. Purdue]|uniref:Lipoprotein n=1 Tax=Mycoplasma haematolamae (strain Purdue) TaxID=1212765 RepID=I7C6F4_MYCHA|nr:hypothetical protein [Candidatus Mycoplasma haematolamae]AFO52087.1 hypothetical protein MHLP_02535 [Candidatus Mycoplasma haematolamae str. Purdue]
MNTFAKAGLYVFSGALFTSAGIACTYFLVQKKLGLENVSGAGEKEQHKFSSFDAENGTISGFLTFSLKKNYKSGETFFSIDFLEKKLYLLQKEFINPNSNKFFAVEVDNIEFDGLAWLLRDVNQLIRKRSSEESAENIEIVALNDVFSDLKEELKLVLKDETFRSISTIISRLMPPK